MKCNSASFVVFSLVILLFPLSCFGHLISGTVSGALSGQGFTYISAYPEIPDTLQMSPYSAILPFGNGNYYLPEVPTGSYIIMAFQDLNGNVLPDNEDYIGYYGGLPPQVIELTGDYPNANITLSDQSGGYLSGDISYLGATTGPTIVEAYDNPDWLGSPVSVGIIYDDQTSPLVLNMFGNGHYEIYLPGDTYYLRAFMDLDFSFAPDPGEPYGEYLDANGLIPISMFEGQVITDIDFCLDPPTVTVSPDFFSAVLVEGDSVVDIMNIGNLGPGVLEYDIYDTSPGFADSRRQARPPAIEIDLISEMNGSGNTNFLDALPPIAQYDETDEIIEETFGSWESTYDGSNRSRGNIYYADSTVTLIEHRFYLSISSSTNLDFAVYQGTGGIYDQFDLIHSVNTISGTGEGWYSSGAIDVTLEAGYYYYICACWEGNTTYGRGGSTPASTSFGHLEAGAGADDYPPPDSLTIFDSSYIYYQTIVTGSGSPWLSYSPDSGGLNPGENENIEVTLNAADLSAGDYDRWLVVSSNDPANPEVTVPVQLTVLPAPPPEITVSPSSFSFTMTIGDSTTDIMNIGNLGPGLLDFEIDVLFQSLIDVEAISRNNPIVYSSKGFRSTEPAVPSNSSKRFEGWVRYEGEETDEFRILLLCSDEEENWSMVQDELVATGLLDLSQIDVLAFPTYLTGDSLIEYDAVLCWSNWPFDDPENVGDALQEYVDIGGGVVLATYALSYDWAIDGGILDPGYSPFLPSDLQSVSGVLDMNSIPPSHPVFEGIIDAPDYWNNENYSNPPLNTGGILLASDIGGNNVVAENTAGNVVDFVVFPGCLIESNSETVLMFANALLYVGSRNDWLTASPSSGLVFSGGSTNIQLAINSSSLTTGDHSADLVISSNDPVNPEVIVPVQLTVDSAEVFDWMTFITATGETGTAPNEFSVIIGGADNQNFLPAPPPPPQYLTWTDLYEPEWASGPYAEMTYVWPPADTTVWLLTVDPNGNVMPPVSRTTIMSWNSAGLSSYGYYWIEDYYTGTVIVADMRTVSSFEVTGTETEYYNLVYAPGPAIEPHFDITPASYDFGSLQAGLASEPVTFYLVNDGLAEGSGIVTLDSTYDFSLSLNTPYSFTLPIGDTLEFTAEFISQPPVNAMKEGLISVYGNYPANDLFCTLQGFTHDNSWVLPMTVTGETGTAPNEFTVNIGGQLEEYLIPCPPPPPLYLTWTELYEPDWASGPYYQLAYQWPFTSNMNWLITIDPNGNVMPPVSRTSNIVWDSGLLPPDGSFSIVEYYSGNVMVANMRADSTFSVTGTEIQYFNILYNSAVSEPIADLTITLNGDDVLLNWEDVPGALMYNIYRSDEAYFDISGMTPYSTSTVSAYTDNSAVSLGDFFYIVTWE